MARLNKAQIIGHIGNDVVLNHTNTNQVPVCNLRIATNEGWTDKATGQKMEATTWHTVVAYRGLAEIAAANLAKGRQVFVEGRIQIRPYMGKAKDANNQPIMLSDGTQLMTLKYATEIVADDIQFLGKKPQDNAYVAPVAGVPAAAPTVVAPAPTVAAPVVAAAGNPAVAAPVFLNSGTPVAPAAAPAPVVAPVAAPVSVAATPVVVETVPGV